MSLQTLESYRCRPATRLGVRPTLAVLAGLAIATACHAQSGQATANDRPESGGAVFGAPSTQPAIELSDREVLERRLRNMNLGEGVLDLVEKVNKAYDVDRYADQFVTRLKMDMVTADGPLERTIAQSGKLFLEWPNSLSLEKTVDAAGLKEVLIANPTERLYQTIRDSSTRPGIFRQGPGVEKFGDLFESSYENEVELLQTASPHIVGMLYPDTMSTLLRGFKDVQVLAPQEIAEVDPITGSERMIPVKVIEARNDDYGMVSYIFVDDDHFIRRIRTDVTERMRKEILNRLDNVQIRKIEVETDISKILTNEDFVVTASTFRAEPQRGLMQGPELPRIDKQRIGLDQLIDNAVSDEEEDELANPEPNNPFPY